VADTDRFVYCAIYGLLATRRQTGRKEIGEREIFYVHLIEYVHLKLLMIVNAHKKKTGGLIPKTITLCFP